jgi:hypothetical protein
MHLFLLNVVFHANAHFSYYPRRTTGDAPHQGSATAPMRWSSAPTSKLQSHDVAPEFIRGPIACHLRRKARRQKRDVGLSSMCGPLQLGRSFRSRRDTISQCPPNFLTAYTHFPSHFYNFETMADQFLGFDLSTQQLKGEPHHSYPTIHR